VSFATVTTLCIYPVKSARGLPLDIARIVSTGFEWDRQWMVVNEKGTFLSQRTHPQLTQIVPELGADALALSAPGLPSLTVPYSHEGERLAVRVHRDCCVGVDQGAEAADWVTQAVGESVRLVRVPQNTERRANPKFAGAEPAPMGFADGYPILVCNQASLDQLNDRMPKPIPMDRFRPNIVLDGLPAWSEDHIDALFIGRVTLRLVKPCTRCSIPSIDQRTGQPSTDPLPVLRPFRFDKELLGITFGENAVIVSGAGSEVRRGSSCRVSFEPAAAAS
jgi:uncharacterized protein